MSKKDNPQNSEMEIDVKRLLNAVVQRAWLVGLVSVMCAVLVFIGTFFFVTPQYKSSAMFYVNNSDISVGGTSLNITASDISASRGLVDTYIVILNTRETLNYVIDYADVDMSCSQLQQMISAEAVEETEVFRVTVTHPDPYKAEKLANAIAQILPKRISSIVEGSYAKVVDSAVVPSSPSSPSYTKNTIIGFAVGLLVTIAVIVLREVLDVSIRKEEDIQQCCNHPVLASVPDMTAPSKGGYYGYGERKKMAAKHASDPEHKVLVGSGISFAASEAYKLLRTKIQYSFAGDKDCRVIGVSSALTGEGKSLTAVNLTHSLSQLGYKVLLIDCDMRRPSLADKLPIQRKPGLSGFLSGQTQENTIFQYCGIPGDEQAFHVIAAGQIPPNPVELLSSTRMSKMLKQLRDIYDYIILDLPPVCEVSDALAVTKETDGILLVARQNHCNRIALGEAIRQFEFVESRILGVAYNCATESSGGYGKKYYKKYYSYSAAGKKANATENK